MTPVGDLEVKTQRRVIAHFRDRLGYRYLGDWHERQNNRNIKEDCLRRFLTRQGHDTAVIAKALEKLAKAAALGEGRTLYAANRDVYGLLRYGARVRLGLGEQTVTVDLIDREILDRVMPSWRRRAEELNRTHLADEVWGELLPVR